MTTSRSVSVLVLTLFILALGCSISPPPQPTPPAPPLPQVVATIDQAIALATAKFTNEFPQIYTEYRLAQTYEFDLYWRISFDFPQPRLHSEKCYIVEKSGGYVEQLNLYSMKPGSERLMDLILSKKPKANTHQSRQ